MKSVQCVGCRTVLHLGLLADTAAARFWTPVSVETETENPYIDMLCPLCRREEHGGKNPHALPSAPVPVS